MKTIIVYYSLEGNTDYAAGKIAGAIGADTLRISPKKAYPTGGFSKFFWGAKARSWERRPNLSPMRLTGRPMTA